MDHVFSYIYNSYPWMKLQAILNWACSSRAMINKLNEVLIEASSSNNGPQVDYLIRQGAEYDALGYNGETALTISAKNSNLAIVKKLLHAGANPDLKNNEGKTPIFAAAENNHFKIVKLLLENNADIYVPTYYGLNVLQWAAEHPINSEFSFNFLRIAGKLHRADIIEKLQNYGVYIDAKNQDGHTALFKAAMFKDFESVSDFVNAGANINATDAEGKTALYHLVEGGDFASVAKLVNLFKADLNIVDIQGKTPLFSIIEAEKFAGAKQLLELGAKIITTEGANLIASVLSSSSDYKAMQLLKIAAEVGRKDVIDALINKEYGFIDGIEHKDQNGNTALFNLALEGNEEAVKLLKTHYKANIDAKNSEGKTSLLKTIQDNELDKAEILLSLGANFDCEDNKGINARYLLVSRSPKDMAIKMLKIALKVNRYDVVESIINKNFGLRDGIESKDINGHTVLYDCAIQGDWKAVKPLVKYFGASIDATDNNKQSALYNLVRKQDFYKAKILQKEYGAQINHKDYQGKTVFFRAAEDQDKAVLQKLYSEFGANIDAEDNSGQTPLMLAVAKHDYDMVLLLLKYGPNIYIKNNHGENAMKIAAKNKDIELLKLAAIHHMYYVIDELIKQGLDINTKDQYNGQTALFSLLQENHFDAAYLLYNKYKADIEARDFQGNTAFMALIENHIDFITLKKLLQQFNISIDATDYQGRTALFKAIENKSYQDVKGLLSLNADIFLKDNSGKSAINLAASRQDMNLLKILASTNCNEIIDALLKEGLSIDAKDKFGMTAFSSLFVQKDFVAAKLLAEKYHANVNTIDIKGETMLHKAADLGDTGMVQKLVVEFGADVNIKNADNITCLMVAASKGKYDTVQKLIELNADINLADRQGNTALMYAAAHNEVEVIDLLNTYPVNLEVRNLNGDTALMLATKSGNLEAIKDLVIHGADLYATNNKGFTPLTIALKNGHLGSIQFLQSYTASLEHQSPASQNYLNEYFRLPLSNYNLFDIDKVNKVEKGSVFAPSAPLEEIVTEMPKPSAPFFEYDENHIAIVGEL